MIVELLGGPRDGEQIAVEDNAMREIRFAVYAPLDFAHAPESAPFAPSLLCAHVYRAVAWLSVPGRQHNVAYFCYKGIE